MSASFKKHKVWPLGTQHISWLSLALCIVSLLGNLAVYFSAVALPLPLLLLNVAAMYGVWHQHRHWRQAISFQPQELADRLLEVQENERHRLSRELHDDIGQLLTAAKMQADWLQRRQPEELQGHFGTLNETLDETLAKVRDVSAILNPRQLSSLGLEASLRAHLLRTLENTPLHWSLECHQRLTGLPEEMAVAAFRIVQEAVTNVLRHAQAQNLLVRVQRLQEGLSLYISDDGAGFTVAANPAHAGQRGTSGMHERAALLGGHLSISSQPGHGTQIEALFPWAPRALERAKLSKGL
ncbi:MAG: sensor histidine kinase [Pseudomonas sp.]|uniref:sensor histidine kinase n=1 Tax=Pseudomonas abieticivorans TaxID=2931382 RepID=UPI0020C17822|nr:sensor histidine kinase [Pseudomonas sp. PIA16]MDE1167642.1 sensor histidine kinase [Pseudomonas sp.]